MVRETKDVALISAPQNVWRQSPLTRIPFAVPSDELDRDFPSVQQPPKRPLAMLEFVLLFSIRDSQRIFPEERRRTKERRGLQVRPNDVSCERPVHARPVTLPRFHQTLEPSRAVEINRLAETQHHVVIARNRLRRVQIRSNVPRIAVHAGPESRIESSE